MAVDTDSFYLQFHSSKRYLYFFFRKVYETFYVIVMVFAKHMLFYFRLCQNDLSLPDRKHKQKKKKESTNSGGHNTYEYCDHHYAV